MVVAWIPKLPNCIVTYSVLHWHFLLKPPLVVKCSVLPPSVTLLWYMTTQVRKHVSINSIQFDHNKHHYTNLVAPLKIMISSCTDLNVDSGSCSNQKHWLRLLPKMLNPALLLHDHLWYAVGLTHTQGYHIKNETGNYSGAWKSQLHHTYSNGTIFKIGSQNQWDINSYLPSFLWFSLDRTIWKVTSRSVWLGVQAHPRKTPLVHSLAQPAQKFGEGQNF